MCMMTRAFASAELAEQGSSLLLWRTADAQCGSAVRPANGAASRESCCGAAAPSGGPWPRSAACHTDAAEGQDVCDHSCGLSGRRSGDHQQLCGWHRRRPCPHGTLKGRLQAPLCSHDSELGDNQLLLRNELHARKTPHSQLCTGRWSAHPSSPARTADSQHGLSACATHRLRAQRQQQWQWCHVLRPSSHLQPCRAASGQ